MPKSLIEKGILICWMGGAAVSCVAAQSPDTRTATQDRVQIAGTWRGNSVCMVKDSPCHDEVNVYRVAEVAGKPGWVLVTGSKVVDGKEVVMGTSEWKYDAQKQVLVWEGPRGTFRLTVQGDRMEGTLTDKDGVVYRRIFLKKEN